MTKVLKLLLLTVAIVFSCSVSLADVTWKKYQYFQNTGGLNDQQSTTEIADNEATSIQNIVFDVGGALKKRFGYLTLSYKNPYKVSSGSSIAVTGTKFFKTDNGNRYLVGVANRDGTATVFKKDYASDGGPQSGPYNIIDGAVNVSPYLNTNPCSFTVAFNALIFTIGTQNKPYMWTGSGHAQKFTTDANCPNATIVCYHKNQLFLTGDSTNPSAVTFSNLATTLTQLQTFSATDVIYVATSDGSKVRALLSAYDSLYIFKDFSIWRLSGKERDSFYLEKLVDGVGTLSQNSPIATNSGIYFTSSDGSVFHYDGAYTVTPISTKINQSINSVNKAELSRTLGIGFSTYRFQDLDYYIAVANNASPTNDTVLLFDNQYKAWTKFTGLHPCSWTVGDNLSGGKSIFFGDYSGYIHEYPSTKYYDGNVTSDAIIATYQTKWFRYPEVCLADKYWRLIKVYGLSNDNVYIHAECKADYEASGKVIDVSLTSSQANWDVDRWDVALWGGSTVIIGRGEVEKGREMFQVKFYNNNVNEGFTLLGWENYIEPTNDAP